MSCHQTILPPAAPLQPYLDALHPDDQRPPQHQFTAERQAAFLSRLAECGSARSAAAAARVSHQTAYRQRRACASFRRAWDAALLVARAQAEEVLACRAIDGIEEEVWFRGEVVGTRRRYDTRLLLAHLARLDKLAEDADAAHLADGFDDALAKLEAGEELPPVPEPAEAPERCSGPCNTRSMSPADQGPEEDADAPLPILERRLRAMEAALPRGAPERLELGLSHDELEELRLAAFEAGVEEWWLIGSFADLDAALDLLEEQEAAEDAAAEAAAAQDVSPAPAPA